MPTRPPKHRPFSHAQHNPKPARKQDRRESSTKRGYGIEWQKLRRAVLAENPLCAHCLKRGEYTTATDVDHVIPFDGRYDEKRLDASNLQPLCSRCHDVKSWTDGTKDGVKRRWKG